MHPPHVCFLLWLMSLSHLTNLFNASTLISAGKVLKKICFLRTSLTAFFIPGWYSFSLMRSVFGILAIVRVVWVVATQAR